MISPTTTASLRAKVAEDEERHGYYPIHDAKPDAILDAEVKLDGEKPKPLCLPRRI